MEAVNPLDARTTYEFDPFNTRDEPDMLARGRIVKAKFPDQDEPNTRWYWLALGNCRVCRYFKLPEAKPMECAHPKVSIKALLEYVNTNTCPYFEAGMDATQSNPYERDMLDVMKTIGLVKGPTTQRVRVLQNEPYSRWVSHQAHIQNEMFLDFARQAQAGEEDDPNDRAGITASLKKVDTRPVVLKFNPNHDEQGRFTSGSSGASGARPSGSSRVVHVHGQLVRIDGERRVSFGAMSVYGTEGMEHTDKDLPHAVARALDFKTTHVKGNVHEVTAHDIDSANDLGHKVRMTYVGRGWRFEHLSPDGDVTTKHRIDSSSKAEAVLAARAMLALHQAEAIRATARGQVEAPKPPTVIPPDAPKPKAASDLAARVKDVKDAFTTDRRQWVPDWKWGEHTLPEHMIGVGHVIQSEIGKRVASEHQTWAKVKVDYDAKFEVAKATSKKITDMALKNQQYTPEFAKASDDLEKIMADISPLMDKEVQLRRELSSAKGRHTQAVLGELREFGSPDGSGAVAEPGYIGRGERVKEAEQYFPREWLDASRRAGSFRVGIPDTSAGVGSGRSYYHHQAVYGGVRMPKLALAHESDSTSERSVAAHELAHRIEHTNNNVLRLEAHYYAQRTADSKLRPLGAGYGVDEKTRPDKFSDPYIGKDYGGGSFEILSMGVEGVYFGRHETHKDEEYERFILGMLASI